MNSSVGTTSGVTTSQTIQIDNSVSGDYGHAATPSSQYLGASGRTGSGWNFFDPEGADPIYGIGSGHNAVTDFETAFERELTHELLHGMGLNNSAYGCGASIMSGAGVPNNLTSSNSDCGPDQPNDCDAQALKNKYPPGYDDTAWWDAYCGVDDAYVTWCETQSDNYVYNYGDCNCELGASPIIVNLDGNGLSLTDVDGGVVFDLLGTGTPVHTAWTQQGSRDAFLVLDRNGNGVIDDGTELFGNVTSQPQPARGVSRNGFLALAVFDSPAEGGNGDGVITPADAVFSKLRLWVDVNHDGISQADELFTLESQGVKSIDLKYRSMGRKDEFGNLLRFTSHISFTEPPMVRGATDVFFLWRW